MRLTDLQIKKLKAPDTGQKTYFDEALRGFGVRVSQGGTKSFVVMYGKRRQLRTLGRYPAMSLSEARIEAKRAQADMAIDVVADPAVAPSISFTKAREKFLADSASRTKPRTVEEYGRLLNRHFDFEKDLGAVTRTDVVDCLEQIKDRPAEKQHAFVAIRTMMNWCRKRGLLETSPVPPLTFKSQPRERVLSDDELRAVWQRAEDVGYPYGVIVQLLILTGQRRGEIAGLRRSWLEDDLVVFPAGFVKNSREHRLPLGQGARTVIASIPETTDLLFPSRLDDEKPFNGWSKCKREFDRPLDVPPYTLHDLRRTYSSNLARLGVPIHVTEKLLNHASGTISGIAAVYNRHSYAAEMREAVAMHDEFLADLTAKSSVA